MAINKKRIYELTDEQTTLTDTDLGVLDKSGYDKAKKFSMLNLYNYISSKNTDEYLYTEVEVSAAQIKSCGGTPIILLSEAGENKYYEYHGFLEKTFGTENFNIFDNAFIGETDNYSGTVFGATLFNLPNNQIVEFSSLTKQNGAIFYDASTDVVSYGPTNLNQAIVLTTWGGTDENIPTPNPSSSTTTFLIKIWYKIRTFGSEL